MYTTRPSRRQHSREQSPHPPTASDEATRVVATSRTLLQIQHIGRQTSPPLTGGILPLTSAADSLRPSQSGGRASTGYAAAYRGLRVERRASRQIFGAGRLRLALCDALQLRKASPLFLIPASEAGRSSGGDRQEAEAERKWVSTTYPRGSATYHALSRGSW